MKPMHFCALLAMLTPLLAGCGGGGGGGSAATRMITIHVQFPTAAASKAGQISSGPPPAQYVTVEAFDGTTALGSVRVSAGVPDAQLSVPSKDLTFYAHGYAVPLTTPAPDANYVTQPATGLLFNTATGKLLAGSDTPQPVSQAITTVSLPSLPAPPTIVFTMNNTIARIQPVAGKTSYALDNGPISLNNSVQAVAADGGVVLVDPSALQWSVASDPLTAAVVSLSNGVLTPTATGTASLTVTDNEVSSFGNQAPIAATISYAITPPVKPADDVQSITLNTQTGSNLLNSMPFYAKSVTILAVQNPLAVGDTPPAPPASTLFYVIPTNNASNMITSLALQKGSINITPTGRTVTVTLQAWSQTDGAGAVVAYGSFATGKLTPTGVNPAAQDLTLTSNVKGFNITPPNPTITLVNPASSSPGFNATHLEVYALIGAAKVPHRIDSRGVLVNLNPTNVVNAAFANDSGGNPFIQVTPATPALAGTAVMTVSDHQLPTLTGATKITVVYGTGGVGLKIH